MKKKMKTTDPETMPFPEASIKANHTPLIILSLFRFRSIHKVWAFGQMAWGRLLLKDLKSLRFWKLMGTGKGIGFSIVPDLGQYGLLTVWDDPDSAYHFMDKGPLPMKMGAHATEQRHFYLIPIKSQGLWSGQNPFEPVWDQMLPKADNLRIAILTRATIAWHSFHRFWQHVPFTSQALAKSDGVQFSAGLGETPFVHQATFSIWDNAQAMKEYAYKNADHLEVIHKTRKERWYAEELFARFYLLEDLKSLSTYK